MIFEAIGTRWQIDIYDEIATEQYETVMRDVRARIDKFDAAYSRFRSDSWVTQISRSAGTYALPADATPLLSLYETLYRQTSGALTPLIGNVLVDAGYDAAYSLQPGVLHAPPVWDDVISFTTESITLRQPALLDFGAAGKGYIIDLVSDILRTHGIVSYCIDAGGDILHRSSAAMSLRIGLEDPADTTCVIGTVNLVNQSLCGSAGNRRAWGDYHHIINPHTLTSPRHILATWVIAETTMLADALATCLFFVPAAQLTPHHQFAFLIMYADRTVEQSPNFPAELFV